MLGDEPRFLKRDGTMHGERTRIGRFELVAELGSGAFGTVYQARDTQLNRDVALKVPNAGVFQTEQEAERFTREARAAARLQHPNICPVHDVLTHEGAPVIVMGFLDGRRLDQVSGRKRLAQFSRVGCAQHFIGWWAEPTLLRSQLVGCGGEQVARGGASEGFFDRREW